MSSPRQGEPPILAVGAVVVGTDRRVLVIRRGKPPAAGTWTLPGGRVEPGESLEAAIVRELREETALETRVVGDLGAVTIAREGFTYRIHEHLVVALGDAQPRPGDDVDEVRWASRDDLRELGILEDALAVIERGLAEAAQWAP